MCYMCNPGGSYGLGITPSYSPLESAVDSYSVSSSYQGMSISHSELETNVISSDEPVISNYSKKNQIYGANMYLSNNNFTSSYSSNPSIFINPLTPKTEFVGEAAEIEDHIKEAFRFTTGDEFPNDIIVKLCDKEELKEAHTILGGVWSDGINGFAVNRKSSGQSSTIFIKKDELARVMITVGHEIGHCLSLPLPNQHDEEAKAFAFELAWVSTLHKHDVANLSNSLVPTLPAKNGLHNVAFNFIRSLIPKFNAIDLFNKLINKEISIKGDIL